jgi:type II secretory pathway pseudopilin PulG
MLMVLLAVINIMIAASLPAWSAVIRRDKEEELVFRGLQYAEAIRVFQNRFQRPPIRLEELIEVEPRSIRKLWKDPMTESGKWSLIPLQGPPGPQVQPNGLNPPPEDPEDEEGRDEDSDEKPEGDDGGFGPKKGEIQVGPFKGVHSRSRKTSFLLFNGRDRYDEWHFTVELFTGETQQKPGGDPSAQRTPQPNAGQFQMSARWIGRPLPAFLQPPQGSGLPQDNQDGDGDPDGRVPRSGRPGKP